jgi:hypothetical protein
MCSNGAGVWAVSGSAYPTGQSAHTALAQRAAEHEDADVLPVIADLVEPMPYPAMQSFFDEDYPPGLRSYTKSHYLDNLDSAAMAALAAAAAALPGWSFIDLHHLEGVPSRTDPRTAAFDHRKSPLRRRVRRGVRGRDRLR